MTESGDGALRLAAQNVARAIVRHATLCAEDPHNAPAIVPALDDLQASLRDYARLVTELSGWADPIGGYALPPEDDTDEEDSSPSPQVAEKDVMVFDHYFLTVENPAEFLEYASARAGTPLTNLDEAVEFLCSKDGWQPQAYPGGVAIETRTIDTCFS